MKELRVELLTRQGQPASILGLAARPQMDASCVSLAFEALINYFFFYDLESENFLDGLKHLLSAKREQVLVATGSQDRDINALSYYLDSVRDRLKVDQLEENLSVLHTPKLLPQEAARWQEYGDLIYGSGQDAFETQWI